MNFTLVLLSGVKGEYGGDGELDGGVGVDSSACGSSWELHPVMWCLRWLSGI